LFEYLSLWPDWALLFSKSQQYERKQTYRKEETAGTEHSRHTGYKEESK
jgi:hypothetical protein